MNSLNNLSANSLQKYILRASILALLTFSIQAQELTISETDDALTIKQGTRTILQYNKSIQQAPEGMDPIYSRSGYIHPVFTPKGQVVTGDFSIKHPHQRGIFFAGTNTTFRGEKVDFWNLHDKLGRIEHEKTISTGSSNDTVSFTVALKHVSTVDGEDIAVLNEEWHVTARQTSGEYFLFDLESNQSLASEDPLVYNEYRYGGMALRGSNQWIILEEGDEAKCAFLTSEGKNRIEGNHTHPRWISTYGEVDGEVANIIVLCHPENFRAPQAARIHPGLPYFSYSPMFDGEFSIQSGETYTSRYRYLVTSSEPDTDWIEEQWRIYTE